MKERAKQEIEALASILSYATRKSVIDNIEISEVDQRLDKVLANLNNDRRFFKRLL